MPTEGSSADQRVRRVFALSRDNNIVRYAITAYRCGLFDGVDDPWESALVYMVEHLVGANEAMKKELVDLPPRALLAPICFMCREKLENADAKADVWPQKPVENRQK